ncbi:MAG: hypothetical protein ACK559_24505, partial [bacterium]
MFSGPLDTVHGLIHPRLGQPLALHSDLIFLGASEEGVEVTHFLVHLPSVQLVSAGLPVPLCGVLTDLLREAVHPGG